MTDLNSIARAMGGEVSGKLARFPTPGHSKRDRGSTAELMATAPDGVLIRSYNGGDPLAIKDELRAKGVLPGREARQSGNNNGNGGGWRCTGTYEYDDGAGQIIYRTRRLECTGQKKRFVAERLEGGQWIAGLGDVDRLPYRFTAICEAFEGARLNDEEPPLIYFAEGERKADKLASWGFLSTSIAFGCKGWRDEYGEAFRDATVIILPDNDEPGAAFAETVKAAVEGVGGKGVILNLPRLSDGGDIVDWDGTADELRALTNKALTGGLLPLPALDRVALSTVPPTSKAFAIERIAPLAEVTLFTGPGSAGKSLLGQQLATAAAAGLPCLGLHVMAEPAIYLTCEDDPDQLHWRQAHICDAMGVPMADLAGKLHLISLRGALDNDLATFDKDGTLTPAKAFTRLQNTIEATGAKLVFLDNVAHLFTGNENDRGHVTRFVNLLNRLAGETGAAIVLLGHPNKSGDSYSGSTAWLNAVRSQFTIDHERDDDGNVRDLDVRVLTVGKANYAKKGEALRFRWHAWAFVRDEDLPTDKRAELAQVVKANGENAAFLRCLDAAIKQRQNVSHNPGVNYYGKLFPTMKEAKGVKRAGFEAAFQRLLSMGEIELDRPLWQRENRAWKYGIKAAEMCTDPPHRPPHQPPAPTLAETGGNPCTDPHAPPPLYTTYIPGAPFEGGAPDPDELDWGDNGEGDA